MAHHARPPAQVSVSCVMQRFGKAIRLSDTLKYPVSSCGSLRIYTMPYQPVFCAISLGQYTVA